MPLRTRLFIILSVIVAIILAISVLLLISKRKQAQEDAVPTTTVEVNGIDQVNRLIAPTITDISPIISNGTITIAQPTTEDLQKNAAKQISKAFTERYGSFSTQNNYQNILEIKDLSTVALYSEISKIMDSKQDQSTYFGMTTKVISMNISNWASDAATIDLSTIRTETKNGQTKNTNQDATVQIIKSGDDWLVNTFQWQ